MPTGRVHSKTSKSVYTMPIGTRSRRPSTRVDGRNRDASAHVASVSLGITLESALSGGMSGAIMRVVRGALHKSVAAADQYHSTPFRCRLHTLMLAIGQALRAEHNPKTRGVGVLPVDV